MKQCEKHIRDGQATNDYKPQANAYNLAFTISKLHSFPTAIMNALTRLNVTL